MLDAIDMSLRQRGYHWTEGVDKLVHHSDAGSQYTSFRSTRHLLDSSIGASIGTVGDALAESAIGLHKTELIKPRGQWHTSWSPDPNNESLPNPGWFVSRSALSMRNSRCVKRSLSRRLIIPWVAGVGGEAPERGALPDVLQMAGKLPGAHRGPRQPQTS